MRLSERWRSEEPLAGNPGVPDLCGAALQAIPGVTFPPPMDRIYQPVVWRACVQVPAGKRDDILAAAIAAKIEMRPFFHSLSSLPPYEKYARPSPNSAGLSATGINLPTSRPVDRQVVNRIVRVFRDVLG